jgi:hypothetical protein
MKGIGMILIVLGIVGLLWGGISWTRQEKVVDLGPVEVNKQTTKSLPVPPIAGAVLVLAGVALVVAGRRG